jgi:carbonic anhydrase
VADTTKVTLNTNPTDEPNPGVNHYTSEFAKTVFGTNSNQWDALQFHMHSPSEHTINGDYYDLEMHTVHAPKGNTEPADGGNGFIASAMGLVFSVDKFTADLTFAQQQVIDIFFDSMKWDAVGESPTVDIVAYGSLMEMADFNNRWVYKGSVTTPPCNINVYWNVLSTIYPI